MTVLKTKNSYELQAERIVDIVNDYFKVECREKTRKVEVSYPRQVAMYFVNLYVKISIGKAAKIFNKTHATVINARKNINEILGSKLPYNVKKAKEIEELRPLIIQTFDLVSEEYKISSLRKEIYNILQSIKEEEKLNRIKETILKPSITQ